MNFADALNKSTSDIEKPPLQPAGTYKWAVEKVPAIESSKDGKWDYLDFQLKCLGAEEDVDQEALNTFGSLANVRQRRRFIFDKNDEQAFNRTLYQVKRFITEHLQVDGADQMELKTALAKSVNHQCLAQIVWSQDREDKDVQYANIGKTAPVA